jgi:bifunctional ADP-heptose synthase (sugar kinase/adenylyltransferase)
VDRWDVINRQAISSEPERRYVAALEAAAAELDCLIVADYDEAGSGVITPRVLERLMEIGRRTQMRMVATSRLRISAFCPSMVVVNEYEAAVARGMVALDLFEPVDAALLAQAGASLARKNGRTAFVTLGKAGIAVYEPDGRRERVPTVEAQGKIDIVGAGDSALAAIAVFLCAGATPVEAAMLGNIAAHVTVRKIGITGAASPDEILRTYDTFFCGQQ